MNLDDTIVAVATPPGRGGIGGIRLAGPEARAIAAPMLRLKHDLEPGRAVVGELIEPCGRGRLAREEVALDPEVLSAEEKSNAPDLKTLLALAARLPENPGALSRIKGVSPGVLQRHGSQLVNGMTKAAQNASNADFVPIAPLPYATFAEIRRDAWLGLLRAEVCATLEVAPEHVLPQRMDKMRLVGTVTMFFAAVNLLRVVPYFALGELNRHSLVISVALMPLAIASNFLGFWLVQRIPTGAFYRITYALMFAISAALLVQGAVGLVR